MTRELRFFGTVDIVTGAGGVVLAEWLSEQLGVEAGVLRIVGALIVVVGIETLLLASKPVMARATMAIEAVVGLAALDLAILGDTTATGTALLAGTVLYCAVAVAKVATTRAPEALVAS